MALTERQQQVKQLQDKGRTPSEIAEALDITVNAVYQQLRRMKAGGGKAKAARKTTARKTASRQRVIQTIQTPDAREIAPRPAAVMTPLQAIRTRRSVLEAAIREAEQAEQAASKALAKASTNLDAARGRVAEEIAQLTTAEAALTGKSHGGVRVAKPRRSSARKRPSRAKAKATTNGKANLASVPTPEPATA